MNFLITGGAGFIGSNYLHYVVNKYPEDRFVCIDALTYAGNYNNIKALENKENFILLLSQTTCTHCMDFKPKLKKVANKYKMFEIK